MSATAFSPLDCMTFTSSRSSASFPYWLSRQYRSLGRYPWGLTLSVGGGSHRAVKPASANSEACSTKTLYQFCLQLSQLKACRMISYPEPAAGPVPVPPLTRKRPSAPPPLWLEGPVTERPSGLLLAERSASMAAIRLSRIAAASALADSWAITCWASTPYSAFMFPSPSTATALAAILVDASSCSIFTRSAADCCMSLAAASSSVAVFSMFDSSASTMEFATDIGRCLVSSDSAATP
mmetsp:Transcript_13902/g.39232  ORF Transcript_13902/g.39232 Transcript_13902/m.39232 type:complete len:238 (+) Transcript_13902:1121-1834(+)